MKTTPRKLHVRTGDTVEVISGKDKGKRGKVLSAFPSEGKVIVQGVNIQTKHTKPRGAGQPGGIIKQEGAIHASKVMLVCKRCNKPVRVGKIVASDGSKVRVCKKCQEVFSV